MNETSESPVTILGVDCAVKPANVGLARAVLDGGRVRVDEVARGRRGEPVFARVAAWVSASSRCLLAVDAPLGWPAALGDLLVAHQAGEQLDAPAHRLFRRRTDDEVAASLGKRPLDVGANLIARTAHSALELLANVRAQTGRRLPLAWQPGPLGVSRGITPKGYSADEARSARMDIMRHLEPENRSPSGRPSRRHRLCPRARRHRLRPSRRRVPPRRCDLAEGSSGSSARRLDLGSAEGGAGMLTI